MNAPSRLRITTLGLPVPAFLFTFLAFSPETYADEINIGEAIEYLERVGRYRPNDEIDRQELSISLSGAVHVSRGSIGYNTYLEADFNLSDVIVEGAGYLYLRCNVSGCISATRYNEERVVTVSNDRIRIDTNTTTGGDFKAFEDLVKHFGGGKKTRYD